MTTSRKTRFIFEAGQKKSRHNRMRFRIHTLDETVFDGEVSGITLGTEAGEITVLSHHTPLITLVKPGAVRVHRAEGDMRVIEIQGGFLEVKPENQGATLLAATMH